MIRLLFGVLAASAVLVVADHAAGTSWALPIGVFAALWGAWLAVGEDARR